jgi:hypothetical protein
VTSSVILFTTILTLLMAIVLWSLILADQFVHSWLQFHVKSCLSAALC